MIHRYIDDCESRTSGSLIYADFSNVFCVWWKGREIGEKEENVGSRGKERAGRMKRYTDMKAIGRSAQVLLFIIIHVCLASCLIVVRGKWEEEASVPSTWSIQGVGKTSCKNHSTTITHLATRKPPPEESYRTWGGRQHMVSNGKTDLSSMHSGDASGSEEEIDDGRQLKAISHLSFYQGYYALRDV